MEPKKKPSQKQIKLSSQVPNKAQANDANIPERPFLTFPHSTVFFEQRMYRADLPVVLKIEGIN